MMQQILDILPVTAPSLQNFIPGRNLELISMIKRILHKKENERFFYIWGNAGCGKSHLLQAIAYHFINKQQSAYYFPGELPADFDVNSDIGCLIIDDVERFDEFAQLKLFNIYNQLRDKNLCFTHSEWQFGTFTIGFAPRSGNTLVLGISLSNA